MQMGQVLTINALTEEEFRSQRRVGETTILKDGNYSVLQRVNMYIILYRKRLIYRSLCKFYE
jgi:hypothetical protein